MTSTIQPIKYGHSEVSPSNDYLELGFRGFNNKVEGRTDGQRTDWAKDTAKLANRSIYTHLAEFILKIPSYFISNSDLKDEWWAKAIYGAERITAAFGDRARNLIYGHKDKDGNLDDNVGAEIHAGANKNYSLGLINNFIQTKGKFLTAALSFISPTIANDIDWAIVQVLDGSWWRNMGANIAYGPDFGINLLHKIFNLDSNPNNPNQNNKLNWEFVKKKFTEHFTNLKNSTGDFLAFCQNADRLASGFLPLVSCLNTIGDVLRPIARRLELTGFSRNFIRILSIIDRPFSWVTNLFRFYLPEKYIQSKQNKDNEHKLPIHVSHSDLLLGAIIGDMADFGLIIFEDKVKETSGNLNDLVEIARRVKDSASNIYFSARRRRAQENIPKPNSN